MSVRRAARTLAAAVSAAALTVGCSDILDVENPNNIAESSLSNAASAKQQANGVLASTVRMLSALKVPYGAATDELDWIGSRDAWLDLERGAIANCLNEFTDGAFPFVGEARYLVDETIKRLIGFDESKLLRDRDDLARTYLYGAIVYATIPDMFDDFAISNKTVAGPPIGRADMGRLYDTAVVYLDRALVIAQATGNKQRQYEALALRARTKHAKAVWRKITPQGQTPSSPLVNDAGASADAQAALALAPATPRMVLFSNIEAQPGINIWFEVNGRNEHRIGRAYSTLTDPISGAAEPASRAAITEFTTAGSQQGPFTLVDDRELRLILAEAALAASPSGSSEFNTQINAVRSASQLPPYTGQIAPLEILKHERMANLWLRMRRLADLYRFGEKVTEARSGAGHGWANDPNFASAFSTPGLLFPIPNVERLANPNIPDGCR